MYLFPSLHWRKAGHYTHSAEHHPLNALTRNWLFLLFCTSLTGPLRLSLRLLSPTLPDRGVCVCRIKVTLYYPLNFFLCNSHTLAKVNPGAVSSQSNELGGLIKFHFFNSSLAWSNWALHSLLSKEHGPWSRLLHGMSCKNLSQEALCPRVGGSGGNLPSAPAAQVSVPGRRAPGLHLLCSRPHHFSIKFVHLGLTPAGRKSTAVAQRARETLLMAGK